MSDIGNNQLKYWNGMLSTGTVNGYYSVVNFDIVAPTYSWYGQKQRTTSFYYKKRDAYINLETGIANNYRDYDVSDIVTLNEDGCGEGSCIRYLMLTNKSSGKLKVLSYTCDTCEINDLCGGNWLFVDDCDESICPCQYDKFLKTDFVRGTRRNLVGSSMVAGIQGIQRNIANGNVGVFEDDARIINNSVVKVGDWIYVYGVSSGTFPTEPTAVCGQARQIVSIQQRTDQNPLYTVDSPWLGLPIETQEGRLASYNVYPEWGEVLLFATGEGIKIIHSKNKNRDYQTGEVILDNNADVTTVCGLGRIATCIYSLNEFNGRINILGQNGFNQNGLDKNNKLYFGETDSAFVGADKLSQTVFRNFLVQFAKDNMTVVVYDPTGNTFSYKLDASFGVFSKTAFVTHQNSLYVIGNDKRMYAVDIQANGNNGYMLNLTDQSAQIKGDLELLQEGDEVNMSADGKHIYIFINNKTHYQNSNNTKTRILKYYRDYNRRVTHDLCCGLIKRKVGSHYLGDDIYTQSLQPETTKDCDKHFVNAYIEAFVGENEDGQTQFTTLAYKQIRRLKILLGKGIYTDGASKVVIDYGNHGYKQQYIVDSFEQIDWIKRNNDIRRGIYEEPDSCIIDALAECTNVHRPCKGQPAANAELTVDGCSNLRTTYMDNCMCLDDKGYALSDVYNIFVDLEHLKKSELYRVKIMSTLGDEMVFGGMVIGLDTFDIANHDSENLDLLNNGNDCCVEGQFIDEQNPCFC